MTDIRRMKETIEQQGQIVQAQDKIIKDLRAELARRDEQIAAVQALHVQDGSQPGWCDHDGYSWPCPTIRALDGAA